MPETESMVRGNGVGKALLAAMQDEVQNEVQKAVMKAMGDIPSMLADRMAGNINVTLDVPSVEVPAAQVQIEPARFDMQPVINVEVPPIQVPQGPAPQVTVNEAVIPAPKVEINFDVDKLGKVIAEALTQIKVEPKFETPERPSKPKTVEVKRDQSGRITSFTVKEG